jgi:AcrR family transcriptional regulator
MSVRDQQRTDQRQTEGDTRLRLLKAAERLIGERGVADVTVRDITSEAGASSASINYHFDTKEGLIRAVMDARFRTTNLTLMQSAVAIGSLGTPSELAMAIVRPAFAYSRSPGSASYMDFVTALLLHRDYVPMVREYYADHIDAFLGAAQVVRPDLDAETVAQRLVFSLFLVFFSAGSNASPLGMWILEIGHDPECIEDQLVAAVTGILAAP